MKSAKQWVDQFSQSGAFDLVENCKEAEFIVRQIQLDAVNELDIRMRQKMKTKKVPFDIYIPASENRAATKATTIYIDVVTDENGKEMITPESSELIDKTQARYMGLLADLDNDHDRQR